MDTPSSQSSSEFQLWIEAVQQTIASYRKFIDGCVNQLSDEQLMRVPDEGINSVAILLRHLGGNLQSRWTDFLSTDGEKPDRNRDQEFATWPGDRPSLLKYFDGGWSALLASLAELTPEHLSQQVTIRGEGHTIPQAIERSLAHIAYHAGQIALVSRMVHQGQWQWLTIPPGGSQQHNQQNWGRPESRGIMGGQDQA